MRRRKHRSGIAVKPGAFWCGAICSPSCPRPPPPGPCPEPLAPPPCRGNDAVPAGRPVRVCFWRGAGPLAGPRQGCGQLLLILDDAVVRGHPRGLSCSQAGQWRPWRQGEGGGAERAALCPYCPLLKRRHHCSSRRCSSALGVLEAGVVASSAWPGRPPSARALSERGAGDAVAVLVRLALLSILGIAIRVVIPAAKQCPCNYSCSARRVTRSDTQ